MLMKKPSKFKEKSKKFKFPLFEGNPTCILKDIPFNSPYFYRYLLDYNSM